MLADRIVIGGPGDRLEEGRALGLDALGPVRVGAADHLGDEAAVGVSEKSDDPRSARASAMLRLRWPCGPSIDPFTPEAPCG